MITINEEDYNRAKRKFKCKVEHINGVGVKTERYHRATNEEQLQMRPLRLNSANVAAKTRSTRTKNTAKNALKS